MVENQGRTKGVQAALFLVEMYLPWQLMSVFLGIRDFLIQAFNLILILIENEMNEKRSNEMTGERRIKIEKMFRRPLLLNSFSCLLP